GRDRVRQAGRDPPQRRYHLADRAECPRRPRHRRPRRHPGRRPRAPRGAGRRSVRRPHRGRTLSRRPARRAGAAPVSLQFPSLQFLVDGLLTGLMIGLGAIGVTLTYAILRFANFAHGELMTFGAYAAWLVSFAIGALAGGTLPALGPFSF